MEQPCGSNSLQISPPSVQLPARRSQHVAPSPQLPQWRLSGLKCPAQPRQPSRSEAGPHRAPTWCSLPRGERCPGDVGEGRGKRDWKPPSCSSCPGEGMYAIQWGRDPKALRGPSHTPLTRGQFGARLEDNLSTPGPGCGFCLLGGCLQPVNEEQGRSRSALRQSLRAMRENRPPPCSGSGLWAVCPGEEPWTLRGPTVSAGEPRWVGRASA